MTVAQMQHMTALPLRNPLGFGRILPQNFVHQDTYLIAN